MLAGLIAGLTGLGGAVVGLPLGLAGAGVAFLGSVLLSRSAAEIDSRNTVLQSDIDSRNQAHRMVQAFAKAQAPDVAVSNEVPFNPSGKSWVNRVSDTTAQRTATNDSQWAARVDAERQAEEQQTLAALGGGRA